VPEDQRLVLVVDDEPAIRDFLQDILEGEGYVVRQAANGVEALAVLTELRPDLIVLDLLMPFMDGIAFRQEQLRSAALSTIPVLVLSAMPDLIRRSVELAADAVLPKPFNIGQLLDTVQRLVSRSSSASAG
jgi:two-component system, chemotaxis family, chemotaxis protein CheY